MTQYEIPQPPHKPVLGLLREKGDLVHYWPALAIVLKSPWSYHDSMAQMCGCALMRGGMRGKVGCEDSPKVSSISLRVGEKQEVSVIGTHWTNTVSPVGTHLGES